MRTIADLGQLPPALIQGLRVLQKGGIAVGTPDEAVEIQHSLPHRHVAAVLAMMRKLDLPRLFGRTATRERELALALVAGRVVAPARSSPPCAR